MRRRSLLMAGGGAAGGAASFGLGSFAWLANPSSGLAAADDFRALVVLFLVGGNDGHNMLVPTDAGYTDYQAARANLALPKASLAAMPGTAGGRSFGLHSALATFVPLYAQQRLAFIANAGPLVVPCTAAQVKANDVEVPPFLGSHIDQIGIQQGWLVSEDSSGWAGRGLELLPSALRNPLAAVTTNNQLRLVQGRRTPVSFLSNRWMWGNVDLTAAATPAAQAIMRLGRQQYANRYEAEYARQYAAGVDDALRYAQLAKAARPPTAEFGNHEIGNRLRLLASLLPVFKSQGFKRQVFFVSWGSFDTHTNQRGSGMGTQDTQLAQLATALSAFDQTNLSNGLDMNVVSVMQSDFGRTVRPGSGGGSEHAWGNHWFALGGPVAGGTVHGSFPSPVLGGHDDHDGGNNGRHVPTTSTDQVAATLMQWLGLPPSQFHEVFPWLVSFQQKTIALLKA